MTLFAFLDNFCLFCGIVTAEALLKGCCRLNQNQQIMIRKDGICRSALLFFLVFSPILSFGQELLVGTYNIRNKNEGDSLRGEIWSKRCQVICDQVNFMSPAIFGTQEVLRGQLSDMLRGLDGYDYVGVGRDDGAEKGEYAAVFYQKARLQLLDKGNFWLNETPDMPRLGWDAACIRICSWGKFKDLLTGCEFYFFNLHMDHVGKVARREGAKLVVNKIREIAAGAPAILTGDFNVDQTDEIYRIFTESGILKDSYLCAPVRFAENGTFNSFNPWLRSESRIDHVFVSPQTEVKAYGMLTDYYLTPYSDEERKGMDAPEELSFHRGVIHLPSDHFPVFVRIILPRGEGFDADF